MRTSLLIHNPFAFKTSLEIALEVAFPILSNKTHEDLKSLLFRIPDSARSLSLNISFHEKKQLIDCINAFKQSKTCYWIRTDFLEAINDIERQF